MVALAAACASCKGKQTQLSSNLAAENKVTVRPVTLYYQGVDMLLGTEQRNVALPENPAAAMPVVIRELFKPPAILVHARSFPADTVVRAAYLLPDGTAFVDLGRHKGRRIPAPCEREKPQVIVGQAGSNLIHKIADR